jgi:hypothetical protein
MGFVPVEMDFIYQEESVFAVVILDAQLVVLPYSALYVQRVIFHQVQLVYLAQIIAMFAPLLQLVLNVLFLLLLMKDYASL